MFRMQKFSIFLLILLTNNYTFAQSQPSPCKLTLQEAPSVGGLHLGMTLQEVTKALNIPFNVEETKTNGAYFYTDLKTGKKKSQTTYANVGEMEATVNNRQELFNKNEKLKGIERIDLKFFENILFEFSIFYEPDTYKFNTIKPFGSTLSSVYKLPAQSWTWFDDTAYMNCKDFKITAFNKTTKITDLSKITPNMKPEDINALPLIEKKFIMFGVSNTKTEDQLKERVSQTGKQEQ